MSIYSLLHRWTLSGGRERAAGAVQGRVLELGIGGGANLPYYRTVERLVGIDPRQKALLHSRQEIGLSAVPFPVGLVRARAEALPFSSGAFDAVIGTLVFCSIREASPALAEVRRVLKPGGTLHLVEHVLPARGPLRLAIRLLAPWWIRVSHECHLDRDTVATLRAAGFDGPVREQMGGILVEISSRLVRK